MMELLVWMVIRDPLDQTETRETVDCPGSLENLDHLDPTDFQ